MPRPIWKGQVSFGLVTIPVQLHSIEARESETRFHLLDKHNHARIRNQRVNEETGKPVEWEDIVKGYELEDGSYVTFTEEELQEVEAEANREIAISDFVPANAIPLEYFEKPYYLIPEKKSRKSYALLREVLKRKKQVAIAKVVIRTREYLSALGAEKNILKLYLLRYAHELKEPDTEAIPSETLKDAGITSREVAIAEQLVEAMSTKWDPEQYRNEYNDTLKSFIEKRSKSKGRKSAASKKEPRETGEVIDIMELLKASMAIESENRPSKKRSA